jgi:hypothetical protein
MTFENPSTEWCSQCQRYRLNCAHLDADRGEGSA